MNFTRSSGAVTKIRLDALDPGTTPRQHVVADRREVALVGLAARAQRDDVVNVECRLLSHVCETAILAAAGALDDEPA